MTTCRCLLPIDIGKLTASEVLGLWESFYMLQYETIPNDPNYVNFLGDDEEVGYKRYKLFLLRSGIWRPPYVSNATGVANPVPYSSLDAPLFAAVLDAYNGSPEDNALFGWLFANYIGGEFDAIRPVEVEGIKTGKLVNGVGCRRWYGDNLHAAYKLGKLSPFAKTSPPLFKPVEPSPLKCQVEKSDGPFDRLVHAAAKILIGKQYGKEVAKELEPIVDQRFACNFSILARSESTKRQAAAAAMDLEKALAHVLCEGRAGRGMKDADSCLARRSQVQGSLPAIWATFSRYLHRDSLPPTGFPKLPSRVNDGSYGSYGWRNCARHASNSPYVYVKVDGAYKWVLRSRVDLSGVPPFDLEPLLEEERKVLTAQNPVLTAQNPVCPAPSFPLDLSLHAPESLPADEDSVNDYPPVERAQAWLVGEEDLGSDTDDSEDDSEDDSDSDSDPERLTFAEALFAIENAEDVKAGRGDVNWSLLSLILAPCFDQRRKPYAERFRAENAEVLFDVIQYIRFDGALGKPAEDYITAAGRKHLEALRLHVLDEADRLFGVSSDGDPSDEDSSPEGSAPVGSSSSRSAALPRPTTVKESDVQAEVEKETGGGHARCACGIVDVLTPTTVIEIKNWSRGVQAIGQLVQYAKCYPGRKKRLHLFGKRPGPKKEANIRRLCRQEGIELTVRKE